MSFKHHDLDFENVNAILGNFIEITFLHGS